MKNGRPIHRRQSGFSLMELIVAIAILGGMLYLVGDLMVRVFGESMRVEKRNTNMLDMSFASRVVTRDLVRAGVSFNTLIVPDDSGSRNFYDFYPAPPSVQDQSSPRKVTLSSATPGRRELLMLLDSKEASTMMYDPVLAYNVEAPPSNWSNPGQVTYQGVNRAGAMQRLFGAVWRPGQLFLFYVPAPIRPSGANAAGIGPSRNYSILGFAQGDDLSEPPFSQSVVSSHPANPSIRINNMDTFFRLLPAIGGAAPVVLAQPVEMLRFKIVSRGHQDILVRQFFRNGSWTEDDVLLVDIDKVEFIRKRVTIPEIEMVVSTKTRATGG